MAQVEVNGWNFDCDIVGHGPDLVFIHGEIHGTAYWANQVAEFSKDHRCLIYHRRGHSLTGAPNFGYSLENQRRDLEGLIKYFGITNPIIVAVAFGTTIAVDYALNHTDKVKGIIMVAWSELHDARLYFDRWLKANELVVRVLENEGRDALLDYLRKEGGRSVYMVIPLNSPIREECIQMFGSHPLEEYKQGMLEFATSVPVLTERFCNLQIPVIGVCGEFDPFPDNPSVLEKMKSFREVPPIAGAGRFVQWEKPEEFNSLVREFILQCDNKN